MEEIAIKTYRSRGGVPHCDDGPAIVYHDGSAEWYRDGQLFHRVFPDGSKHWYDPNDRETFHRLDGPAKITSDGTEHYYIHGKYQHKVLILDNKFNIVYFLFHSDVPKNYELTTLPYRGDYWAYIIHPDDIALFLLEHSDTMIIGPK